MQQKLMHVGMEVGIQGLGQGGDYRRAKVLRLGVARILSSVSDGVEVEYLEPCAPYEPGKKRVERSRDISMPWERAAELQAERDEKKRIRTEMHDAAIARIQALGDSIAVITGKDPMIELARGREIGRTPANRVILQDKGDRIAIDTALVEALVKKLRGEDRP